MILCSSSSSSSSSNSSVSVSAQHTWTVQRGIAVYLRTCGLWKWWRVQCGVEALFASVVTTLWSLQMVVRASFCSVVFYSSPCGSSTNTVSCKCGLHTCKILWSFKMMWRRCLHSRLRFLHCGHSNLQPPKLSTQAPPQYFFTNTNTQIHMYTNTNIHKHTNFTSIGGWLRAPKSKFQILTTGIVLSEQK